ncbi:MAG TPA: ATP-binding protein [Candidatus Sulfotelmatobacter sp.]|nr:ATP-binding protein [Candidatus Sulfotelmatobacter sp.]
MVSPDKSKSRELFSALVRPVRNSFLVRGASRHISVVLLFLLLIGEVGLALFVMRDLGKSYATVERMYTGSVQGLLRFGDLQYDAQETRRSTLYALSTNDANLQVQYADQSRTADRGVTQGIALYLGQAKSQREAEVGERLAKDWSDYLRVRDAVLGLIMEGSPKEAVQLDLHSGVLEFDRVRRDLAEIKQSYDQQAALQLATAAQLSRRSMAKLTAALIFGLVFGTVGIWAIQRSRMRSTVQLARLQMDFVASVSHELRTPLAAILLAGENVRDGFALDHNRLFEQGSVITDQATQLMDLIDQVLTFAATSEAKFPHPLRELLVSDVIEHALRSTQGMSQKEGFVVDVRVDPDLPPIVADMSVLSQCLQNLILNAVKYSKGHRWIGISAGMSREASEILISVEDHGIGIQPAELSRIFEAFYRSPEVTSNIHGTGLGLSIAKRSAEVFGGKLTVSSQVGVGSVFTVHLPLAKNAREKAAFEPSAIHGARV